MKKIILFFGIVLASLSSSAADTTHVSVQVGGLSKFAAIAVTDIVTGNNVVATITDIVVQNNNPSVATVTNSSGNTIRVVPVLEGSGTAVVSCNVSYVDPGDGQTKNEAKTIVVSYTVIGAPHGVKLSLTFN
jgi:hypothetical protein